MDLMQEKVKYFNEKKGDRNIYDGIDCPHCLNRGYVYVIKSDEIAYETCSCMKRRKIALTVKKSGLEANFKKYTFENYHAVESWQKHIKNLALEYVKAPKWFFISGQVGSGKTHICTAISSALIERGYDFKYFDYAHDMPKLQRDLKSGWSDTAQKADEELQSLRTVEVLYIDDFLKTGETNAFDLINYRYAKNLITIISSETTFDDDELSRDAMASRIYEKCGKYFIQISNDSKKNQRMVE